MAVRGVVWTLVGDTDAPPVAIEAVVWELYGETQPVEAGVEISFLATSPAASLTATIEVAPATADISFAATSPAAFLSATILVSAAEVADPPLTPVKVLSVPAAGAVSVNNTNVPDPNADGWEIEWHDGDGQWEPLAAIPGWPFTHTPGGGTFYYRARGRRWED
jgi:hypothetical protein